MNTKKSLVMVAGLAALFGGGTPAHSAEIFKNQDLTLNVGGRFKEIGELSYAEADDKRDMTRIYLWNTQDRIMLSGVYDGTKFSLEEALGGEAVNTSNNQINLLEFMAVVPTFIDNVSIVAGQFKNPANRDSAEDSGYSFFTEKDMLQQMFFNAGYDTGVGLNARLGQVDVMAGTLAGAPDLPQRYLPEVLNQPMLYARIGWDNIGDDPFHPKAWGLAHPDGAQFAIHGNAMYMVDSNAGHSTNASLGSGYFDAPSANSYYGNVLLSSKWNPYLGKTANGANVEVDSTYGQVSVDTQFRTALGKESTLNIGAQATWSEYTADNMAKGPNPFKLNGVTVNAATIDLLGGQVYIAAETGTFDIAARAVVVVPSQGLMGNNGTTNGPANPIQYTPILPTGPIWDVTFPSVGWHVSKASKLTAEATFEFNAPMDRADDGAYSIAEMPSQVANNGIKTPASSHNYKFLSTPVLPIARLEYQLQF